jgi:general nucleoside transport system ATP-binding protein
VTPALELRGISKRFGALQALDHVNFTLAQGEVHALLGENGAGKSTLMKVAFGLLTPDGGTIAIGGEVRRLRDPIDARAYGIGMVHQHFTSIPAFSVSECLALAAGWPLRPASVRSRLRDLSEQTGLGLDPDARVADLSAGLKQRLEVLKALAIDARMLLLDEPSSVLSPAETDAFLGLVVRLKHRGVSSVLITHKLNEALAIADRVTVLRHGRVVHCGSIPDQRPESLARHMLGEAPPLQGSVPVRHPGSITIRSQKLVVPRLGASGPGLRAASFAVRAGELVGIAGVEGNGQRELLRAIAGLARPSAGTLQVEGLVSFVPEDRTSEGIIGELTLTEHLVLSQGARAPWVHGPWINWEMASVRTRELVESYGVRANGPHALARTLSGGNQQRIILAAALECAPQILVAENPTRGLDVRAISDIHRRLRAAAAGNVSVIVHMADLDELLELTDTVMVMADGVLTEMPPGSSRDEIGRRMLRASTP